MHVYTHLNYHSIIRTLLDPPLPSVWVTGVGPYIQAVGYKETTVTGNTNGVHTN